MKTLFEELSHIPEPDLDPNVRASLNTAARIRANNVYAYMAEDKKDFASLIEHLPIVIPPFPTTWIEFDLSDQNDKATAGYLLIREKIGEETTLQLPKKVRESGATWAVYAQAFTRGGTVQMPLSDGSTTFIHLENGKSPFSFLLSLHEDGTIIGDQNGILISFAPQYEAALRQNNYYDLSRIAELEIFSVALFALSLLSCKNVTLEAVDPPATLKHRNRHVQPAISYHVLKIRPMSTHTRGGGQWIGGGSPSLHIRRGHFKDYREGEGLFGRVHGIYWWESAVVGRAGSVVEKDYEIDPK
jgi:hypothetical protein